MTAKHAPIDFPLRAIDLEELGISVGFISGGSHERNTQARANARLIAASRDMLKALVACAEQLEMITGKVHDERCAWIDARAAIAKATGQ